MLTRISLKSLTCTASNLLVKVISSVPIRVVVAVLVSRTGGGVLVTTRELAQVRSFESTTSTSPVIVVMIVRVVRIESVAVIVLVEVCVIVAGVIVTTWEYVSMF